MQTIVQNHTPLHLTYKNCTKILYVTPIDNHIYININSISSNINKWNRGANVSKMILELNNSFQPFKSYISIKNQGTWIVLELFENFGNWLFRNNTELAGYGTYVKNHLPNLYKNYTEGSDPYFKSFTYKNKRCIIRANRDTNFINLTDILNIYEKDIRSWKKTIAYKEYVEKNPTHITSSNNSLDEFGTRTSFGNSQITRVLLQWLYNNNKEQDLYNNIKDFLNDEEKVDEKVDEKVEEEVSPTVSVNFTDGIEQTKEGQEIKNHNSSSIELSGVIVLARQQDRYINATQLCKAGRKKFNDWKRLDSTTRLLQALENDTGIISSQLIDVKKGNTSKFTQGSWIHPDLAVQLAQWISPEFSLKVSRWVREICLTGSVTLGNEMSSDELKEEMSRRIGIDVRPYDKKDVVYIFSFSPTGKYVVESGKIYYKFGVSSNVSNRLDSHEYDRLMNNICMLDVFTCKNRSQAAGAEKRLKRIVSSMGIGIDYYKKKECFIATEEEYNLVCDNLREYLNGEYIEEDREDEELDKKLWFEEKKIIYELYREGKFDYNQLKEMLSMNKICNF